jgi:hypothetical protein
MNWGHGLTPLAANKVATRNILNPLLWLCAIVTPASLVAAPFASGALLTVLLITALVPPACTLAAYGYWTFKEPNRLQSEDFVLQKQWLDTNALIGDNRTQQVIDVTPGQSQMTANTAPGEAA